jgi:hypothetical protein
VDNTQFRLDFPEFSDTAKYPDSQLNFWSGVAELQVRECVWKTMWTQGVKLYVAHEITMAAQNVKTAAVGGTPGTQGGIPNNKTVGSVTVGYDSQSNSEKDAGWWNNTNYGKQFIRLARIFGAGAIQL